MLTDAELLRYNRQILMPQWDIAAQEKIRAATVLIVGMGGLGCPVALYLAAAGVGELRLADFDSVEESNLQRQVLYRQEDVGHSKAVAAARNWRWSIPMCGWSRSRRRWMPTICPHRWRRRIWCWTVPTTFPRAMPSTGLAFRQVSR